jgi:glycine dehydrogenase subunit 2
MLNSQGRATRPEVIGGEPGEGPLTFTGHKGLAQEEAGLFEIGRAEATGVDLPEVRGLSRRTGAAPLRAEAIGIPGLSEPEAVRHYTRLSRQNYAIDMGLYPLGSCTMKHNPRLNEKMARLPGFADLHPLQPVSTTQGALELMEQLSDWLLKLTGMSAVALSPAAGAHGEFCGLAAIRAALAHQGSSRNIVLVPDSAHGTNPATAAALGFEVVAVPSAEDGRVDRAAMLAALNDGVAAIMLTNPNTCGLFERDIREIADAVHAAGAYFYCDGANFNAIVGRVRPADLGIDAMHLNLHKTFSTPHGGGGPGSGPVVFSEALAQFVPVPFLKREGDALALVEEAGETPAFGRLKAFHGQMGMFVRALTYMLSHGADGLRQVSTDAVLAANYVRARLKDVMSVSYPGFCMHEVLFDERFLKGTGISTLDFAKALIDEGYHPMTVYFPLVVKGAMLVEPTETESRRSLDRFIDTLDFLAKSAKSGDTARFLSAPRHTPRRRLDETRAARQPVLRWRNQGT